MPHHHHHHLLRMVTRPAVLKKLAVVDATGARLTYEQVVFDSLKLARALRLRNIQEPTIAAFQKGSSGYVSTMLATWMVGKRFLPLCTTHPEAELQYFVQDSRAGCIVYTSADADACGKHSYNALPNLRVPLLDCSTLILDGTGDVGGGEGATCSEPEMASDALILYTSGTTGRPKGVVHSHLGVTRMMQGLVQSWQYTPLDHILHFLPLHHLHGVLNKLLCVLYAGGSLEFLPSATAEALWRRLAAEGSNGQRSLQQDPVTLFMAVPTVYARMIEFAHEAAKRAEFSSGGGGGSGNGGGESSRKDHEMVQRAVVGIRRDVRLMACGSAALPDSIMSAWQRLTGQVLLERYGMTEIGMGLTNDYEPVVNRTPGHVGRPLPYVEVRIVDDHEREVPGSNSATSGGGGGGGGGGPAEAEAGKDDAVPAGELRVRGPTVFREYLNRPEAFRDSFDSQGWFKTGDVAVRRRNGMYAILGRSSTDIIKSRGYKLSALEIERELLACEDVVREVAVLGCPHPVYGEMVVAIVVLQEGSCAPDHDASTLRIKAFLHDRLAIYKCPARYRYVAQLPRNALGKVNKKSLLKDLFISVESLM